MQSDRVDKSAHEWDSGAKHATNNATKTVETPVVQHGNASSLRNKFEHLAMERQNQARISY